MVNDLPDIPHREKKSKTPLIIGIVVALHVVLIGSAFVIQEINKRTRPLEEAVVSEPEQPAAAVADAQAPLMDAPQAPEPLITQSQPQFQPQPIVKTAKPNVSAPKTKTLVKSYTVKKGDTWTTVSAKLKTPSKTLAKQNKLDTKKYLQVGQKLTYRQTIKIPAKVETADSLDAAAPSALSATGSAPSAASPLTVYEVKKGDTLGSIAARHAMKIKDLKEANDMKEDRIVPGQKLKVLQPGPKPATQSLLAGVQPRDSAPMIHLVTSGETLSGLSRRYGVSQSVLMRANNIDDPAKIGVGSRIKIPTEEIRAATGDLTSAKSETVAEELDAAPPMPQIEEEVAANF